MKKLASDKKHFGADIGMTGVLHTNSRKLDYHPHIHYIVPSGGINVEQKLWKKKKGKYLMPSKPLALLFRGELIALMKEKNIPIPNGIYGHKWVVNIKNVGKGEPALKYLSRYLYRGVISEKRIIKDEDGLVTFVYTESKSGKQKTRTLPGETFLFLVLSHVLPKGFRRCRDYGFLHGNAHKTLGLLQLVLQVVLPEIEKSVVPVFKCSHCSKPMILSLVKVFRSQPFVPIRASPN